MPTDVSEAKGTKRLFAELDPIWSADQWTVHPVRWEGVSRFGRGGTGGGGGRGGSTHLSAAQPQRLRWELNHCSESQ